MAESAPLCKIIASGGVSTESDIDQLREIASKQDNLEGVIIGKALYEKTVQLENVIQ